MILVDTSVWIDHLHSSEPRLVRMLADDEVACHPCVVEELALGSIKDRPSVLAALTALRRFPVISHAELLLLVEARQLWGRGLSAVDVHLLGAALVEPAGRIWSRDKRLLAAAAELGLDAGPDTTAS